MWSKFMRFHVGALAAVIWALLGMACAVVESTAPGAGTLPQGGAAKAYPARGELDAMIKRIATYWNPPAGVKNPEEIIVRVRISLKPDGTLASPPVVVTAGTSEHYLAARNSAVRAIVRSQPFDMLSPANYNAWKQIEITFDPRTMGRR